MTVDEAQWRVRVIAAYRRDSLPRLATDAERKLYRDTLLEIASNPNADARALARAAIGADDETR